MKKKLMFAQAFLFLMVFIFFGLIIIREKGNIFIVGKVEEELNNYYKENYDLKNIKKSDLVFDFKNKSYYITYTNKDEELLSFKLVYKNKKITSNYQKEYLEGNSLLKKRSKLVKNKLEKIFKSNYHIESVLFAKLNTYRESDQELIINNKDLTTTNLYSLNLTTDIDNIDEVIRILDDNNLSPISVNVTLKNGLKTSTISIEKGVEEKWQNVSSVK